MLWQPGKPLMWILQIDGFSTYHAPEGEVRVSVGVLEKGMREESEATICGREYRTQKHQCESFGNRAWKVPLLFKSEGGLPAVRIYPQINLPCLHV